MVTLATMTAATAQQRLGAGVARFGLAMPRLAPQWGNAGAFDAGALTLAIAGPVLAPWSGTLEAGPSTDFRGASGLPIFDANVGIFRWHPLAARRLALLAARRYAGSAPHPRPMPVAMLVRGAAYTGAPFRHDAGDALSGTAATSVISFHDACGQIVCPIAVAAMFADLMQAHPALRSAAPQLGAVIAKASGTAMHLVDPHGTVLEAEARALVTLAGASPADTLLDWPAGQALTPAPGATARIGFGAGGRLGTMPLSPPEPAQGTLPRQFVRVVVAELPWLLLGNRGATPRAGVPADDGRTPADLLPAIHTDAAVTLLADGPGTLAAANAVADRIAFASPGVPGTPGLFLLASPVIERAVGASAAPWPPFSGAAGVPVPLAAAIAVTATWIGTGPDVRLSVPGAGLPANGHLRAYPRAFQRIATIGATPSFVRGDGGAAPIAAPPPAAVDVLLPNPLDLAPGQPRPAGATLAVDLVVTDRSGWRVTRAIHALAIQPGPAVAPADPWTAADMVDLWPPALQSVAPSTLFAAPAPTGGGTPVGVTSPDLLVNLVRKLGSETSPRSGPRLPTMARFDTVVATGAETTPDAAHAWEAVLTGGRWARETRSAHHALGNPGQPAGPDVHAPGVRVRGPLALDLARHALKRAQPMVPLLPPTGGALPGWLVMLLTGAFDPPAAPGTAAADAPSFSAAMLTTVAAFCDTPELTLFDEPQGPLSLQEFANRVAGKLGVPPPTITQTPGTARALAEARREMVRARHGSRDAAWSLRRALSQATELIYLEGPAFGPTRYPAPWAPPTGPDPAAPDDPLETPDLLQAIMQAMSTHPAVRLIVAVSREADFAPGRPGWIAQAAAQRRAAVDWLAALFPGRVAVFHPAGFPGRAARLRTSVAIVDDVFALVGTSHFRRRGHAFDGAVDVALIDDDLAAGHSPAIRAFRQSLLAAKLGVLPPAPPLAAATMPSADWDRLHETRSAFDFVAELLTQGGLGRLSPLWPGPDDPGVLAAPAHQADPNGMGGSDATLQIAALLDGLDQA